MIYVVVERFGIIFFNIRFGIWKDGDLLNSPEKLQTSVCSTQYGHSSDTVTCMGDVKALLACSPLVSPGTQETTIGDKYKKGDATRSFCRVKPFKAIRLGK